jgi:hypothetical protein
MRRHEMNYATIWMRKTDNQAMEDLKKRNKEVIEVKRHTGGIDIHFIDGSSLYYPPM